MPRIRRHRRVRAWRAGRGCRLSRGGMTAAAAVIALVLAVPARLDPSDLLAATSGPRSVGMGCWLKPTPRADRPGRQGRRGTAGPDPARTPDGTAPRPAPVDRVRAVDGVRVWAPQRLRPGLGIMSPRDRLSPSGPWALLGPLPLGIPGPTCRHEPPRRSSGVAVRSGAGRTDGHRAGPTAHGAAPVRGAGTHLLIKSARTNYPPGMRERAAGARKRGGWVGRGRGHGARAPSAPYGPGRPRPTHPLGFSFVLPRPTAAGCGSVEEVERTRFARRLKKQGTASVQVERLPRASGGPRSGLRRGLRRVQGPRARFRAGCVAGRPQRRLRLL